MKIIVLFLLVSFAWNTYPKTDREVVKQSLKTYLELKEGKDVLTLLVYKDIGSIYSDDKITKKIDMFFKLKIAGEIYFRKLSQDLTFKATTEFKPLPYILVFLAGGLAGWALAK